MELSIEMRPGDMRPWQKRSYWRRNYIFRYEVSWPLLKKAAYTRCDRTAGNNKSAPLLVRLQEANIRYALPILYQKVMNMVS